MGIILALGKQNNNNPAIVTLTFSYNLYEHHNMTIGIHLPVYIIIP